MDVVQPTIGSSCIHGINYGINIASEAVTAGAATLFDSVSYDSGWNPRILESFEEHTSHPLESRYSTSYSTYMGTLQLEDNL